MCKPLASTHGVYIPGTGITITRANIRDEQQRRAYENQSAATPEQIVLSFATYTEQHSKTYQQSKRFAKLVSRASSIMRRMQRSGR